MISGRLTARRVASSRGYQPVLLAGLLVIVLCIAMAVLLPEAGAVFLFLGFLVGTALVFTHWGSFPLVLVLLAWLPFQNGVVAITTVVGAISVVSGQLLVVLKEVLVVCLLGCLLITGRLRGWQKTDGFFAAFCIWVVLHLPFGGLTLMARLSGLRMLLIPLLLYFLGRFLPMPPDAPRHLWLVVIATTLTAIVLGCVEFALVSNDQLGQLQAAMYKTKGLAGTPDLGGGTLGVFYTAIGSVFDNNIIWVRRMTSTYLEPLALGHALIFPLLFLFYCFVGPRPALTRPRWLVGLLLVPYGLTQILALSRGAILATLFGGAIIGLSSRRIRARFVLIFALVLIVAMAVPRVRSFTLNTLRFEDPSTRNHVSQLNMGIDLLMHQPFGLGLGQGGYAGAAYSGGEAEGSAESFYFSLSSQVGWIGLGIFVIGLARLLLVLRRISRWKAGSVWLRASAQVTMAAMAGYAVSAVFSEAAFGLLGSAALWFMAGAIIQLGDREAQYRRRLCGTMAQA